VTNAKLGISFLTVAAKRAAEKTATLAQQGSSMMAQSVVIAQMDAFHALEMPLIALPASMATTRR